MKSFAFAAVAASLIATAPAYAAARDLEGTWQAQRGGGVGLSTLEITFQGSTFAIYASAPCGRRPCDLGQTTGYVLVQPGAGNPDRDAVGVSAGFEARDSTRQVIAIGGRGNSLQVTVIQSFRDGRPAAYTTETFYRSR